MRGIAVLIGFLLFQMVLWIHTYVASLFIAFILTPLLLRRIKDILIIVKDGLRENKNGLDTGLLDGIGCMVQRVISEAKSYIGVGIGVKG